ncbi:hypothetical protein IGI04_037512, partial [Brassica rapa subsp. trilocularis]
NGVGDKAVNQLDNSVNLNLEATIAINLSIENKEAAEKIHGGTTQVFLISVGPRYLLLQVKCIRWLNLSPISSLVLDILEYKSINDGEKHGKQLEAVSNVKLLKNWLKSQNFHEHCIFSVIESCCPLCSIERNFHISFPELTIPL